MRIATVRFRLGGKLRVAYLGPDLSWRCPAIPLMAAALNLNFPVLNDSPAVGVPGAAEAHAAAAYLQGELHITPTGPTPKGVTF